MTTQVILSKYLIRYLGLRGFNMFAIKIDEEKRIQWSTYEEYATEDLILVESLPTGETEKEKDITNWLYVDSEYVYDPLPDPPPRPEPLDLEKIDAQVLYTAMMTDTVLEDDDEG